MEFFFPFRCVCVSSVNLRSLSFCHSSLSFFHSSLSPLTTQTNTSKVLLKITHIYPSLHLSTHTLHLHIPLRAVHKRDVRLLQIRHIYTSPPSHSPTLKNGTNRVMERPTPLSFGCKRREFWQVYQRRTCSAKETEGAATHLNGLQRGQV